MNIRRPRLGMTTLLTAATFGVYLLVVVGATASLSNAAEACSSWPVCTNAPDSTAAYVALGHHLMAALVGILVVAAAIAAFRGETTRKVKATVAIALVLYPAQIGIGALIATATTVPGGVHLLAGVTIFGLLLVALAWHLEYVTGGADEPLTSEAVEPVEAEKPSEAPVKPLSDQTLWTQFKARSFAYFKLMKPRLMWLLSLVAAAAMALAAGSSLTVDVIVLTLGGGVLAIGASGTFNHVLERDIDKKMSRTNDRPLVTHEVPARNALVFGFVLTLLSLLVFLQLNPLAAALGLVAIIFYSVVYTLILKPNTVQNTVIGGAAGSLPALIGWAGVTGRIDVAGLLLAALIFVWTPAHFYNLALAYKEDYARGGFPMMPNVRGETTTRKHILCWLGSTLAFASALIWVTDLGWVTAVTTAVLGAVFLLAVVNLHYEQTEQAAFRAFHASNAYLGLVLIAIVIDALAF